MTQLVGVITIADGATAEVSVNDVGGIELALRPLNSTGTPPASAVMRIGTAQCLASLLNVASGVATAICREQMVAAE